MADSRIKNDDVVTHLQELNNLRSTIRNKIGEKEYKKLPWSNLDNIINGCDTYLKLRTRANAAEVVGPRFNNINHYIDAFTGQAANITVSEKERLLKCLSLLGAAIQADVAKLTKQAIAAEKKDNPDKMFEDLPGSSYDFSKKPAKKITEKGFFAPSGYKVGVAILVGLVVGAVLLASGPPGWVLGLSIGGGLITGWAAGNGIENLDSRSEASETQSIASNKSSYQSLPTNSGSPQKRAGLLPTNRETKRYDRDSNPERESLLGDRKRSPSPPRRAPQADIKRGRLARIETKTEELANQTRNKKH